MKWKLKNLPPLEVSTIYRATDFESFEFSAQSLHRSVTGEDIPFFVFVSAMIPQLRYPRRATIYITCFEF